MATSRNRKAKRGGDRSPLLSLFIAILFVLLIYSMSVVCFSNDYSINGIKEYFSIVSSVFASLIGVSGIILGYFYYSNRLQYEEKQKQREKLELKKNRLEHEFEYCDDCMEQILSSPHTTQDKLYQLSNSILKHTSIITCILDKYTDLLHLSDDEISTLIEWNSLINTNDISYFPDEISEETISSLRVRYKPLAELVRSLFI